MVVGTLILVFIFEICRGLIVLSFTLSASNNMHARMTEVLLRSKSSFYDANPVGRILTRFTKDMIVLDVILPPLVLITSYGFFRVGFILLGAFFVSFGMGIFLFLCILGCLAIVYFAQQPMVEAQRLESIYRGPIHSTFSFMQEGIVSIRAYDKIDFFQVNFAQNIEKGANMSFTFNVMTNWLAVRLDLVVLMIGSITAIAAVLSRGEEPDEEKQQSLIFLLQSIPEMMAFFSITLRMWAELVNYMTSSQRVYNYTLLDNEDDFEKTSDDSLKEQNWPGQGSIEFDNATMQYRMHLKLVLKQVSFKVQPGMKVGIVGRSAAGKSSVFQSLFRLAELVSGKISIDEVSTKDIGLHSLRKRMGYIPKQPFLVNGTIKENVDVDDSLSHIEVHKLLKRVGLASKVESLANGVDTFVTDKENCLS